MVFKADFISVSRLTGVETAGEERVPADIECAPECSEIENSTWPKAEQ
jgi:hypothetical protein